MMNKWISRYILPQSVNGLPPESTLSVRLWNRDPQEELEGTLPQKEMISQTSYKFHEIPNKHSPPLKSFLTKKQFILDDTCVLSCVQLSETPWIVTCQAPLSMGFSRQEYWSGLPFPSPRDLPNPGIEPRSPALAGRFFTVWATKKAWFGWE